MSLDERLMVSLRGLGELGSSELERAKVTVLARGRRRRTRRRVVAALTVLTIVASGAVVLPRLAGVLSTQRPGVPAALGDAARELVGTYRIHISRREAAAWSPELRGTWVMTFSATGSVLIVPPPSMMRSVGALTDTVEATETEIRINAFTAPGLCDGTPDGWGRYQWSIAEDPDVPRLNGQRVVLRLVSIADPCEVRRLLFTTGPWRRH